jgi:hypothetical protein
MVPEVDPLGNVFCLRESEADVRRIGGGELWCGVTGFWGLRKQNVVSETTATKELARSGLQVNLKK